jgi:hypothetical protein
MGEILHWVRLVSQVSVLGSCYSLPALRFEMPLGRSASVLRPGPRFGWWACQHYSCRPIFPRKDVIRTTELNHTWA